MLLAAMLAMVLAAAAPVFAQVESEVDGDDNETNTAQYVDCSQVQAAIQAQYGDASANADDESDAVAEVATDQGITFNQANACLGEINDLNQGNDNVGDVVVGSVAAGDDGSAAAAGSASASAAAGSASAATETLPETGGSSLLALGAGALLVAGGLLARRIVR
jgi:LPXTG-motif cell wall-anchored protein